MTMRSGECGFAQLCSDVPVLAAVVGEYRHDAFPGEETFQVPPRESVDLLFVKGR